MTNVDFADHHCSCYGLHIRSQIALPEIDDTSASDAPGLPHVAVRRGNVPDAQRDGGAGDGLWVDDGRVSFDIAGVARYLVRDGCEIVVDPAPGASLRDIRLYLLGSAFGILCHQRGLMPLHANAIVVQGEAVAFAGVTGAGKSTLAAYFQSCGHQLLCDDVCVVSFDESGRPLAWPGPPRLKLWRDALAAFGHDGERLERVVERRDKFHLPFSRSIGHAPFPLRRLYVLRTNETQAESSFSRLRGASAIEAIAAQTYRSRFLGRMGLQMRHLRQSAALAKHSEIYVASRPWGFGVFAREAERILRHAEDRRRDSAPSSDFS